MILSKGEDGSIATYMVMLLQPGVSDEDFVNGEVGMDDLESLFGFGPVPDVGDEFEFGAPGKQSSCTIFTCHGIIPANCEYNKLPIPLVVVRRAWAVSTAKH